ncbi:MAG TPA: hypothetical protein VIG61_06840 [Fusobacterium sp.]|uniref:hypothetical protein n=1 Tax=Fusobacterium sp. TaxID=68766 RepID=UPI002F406BFA
MNFKDELEEDLEKVFFNEEEFAEKVMIEGIRVSGIFSKKKFVQEYMDKSAEHDLGLFQPGVCLSLRKKEVLEKFEILPEAGDRIEINTTEYTVLSIDDKSGEFVMYLEDLED